MGSFPHMLGGFTDAHRTEPSPYRDPSFARYSNPDGHASPTAARMRRTVRIGIAINSGTVSVGTKPNFL